MPVALSCSTGFIIYDADTRNRSGQRELAAAQLELEYPTPFVKLKTVTFSHSPGLLWTRFAHLISACKGAR